MLALPKKSPNALVQSQDDAICRLRSTKRGTPSPRKGDTMSYRSRALFLTH